MTQAPSSNPRRDISVMVAFSQRLYLDALSRVLQEAGMTVLGCGQSFGEVRHLALRERPDVFLLLEDFAEDRECVVSSLAQEFPQSAVVVMRSPESSCDVMADVHAGAMGCLSVNLSPQDFATSLRMAVQGAVVVSRELNEDLGWEALGELEARATDSLTERERNILALLGKGRGNQEIAEFLSITENTAKVHVKNILDKLGLRNRQQAAAFAVWEGLAEDLQQPQEPSEPPQP